jgi:hypothetical protein
MRHLPVLVLVILASLHANPQVSVNAGVQPKRSPSHKNQADSEAQQRPPDSAPDSVDGSQTRKNTPDQDKQNGQRDSDDRAYRVNIESEPTSGWTIAYVFITAVLGLLGAGTLWVLIYQTTTLGKQVRLQERGQRQWVNTSEWQAGFTDMWSPDHRPVLEITFKVSNITKAPITINIIRAASQQHEPIGGDSGWAKNTMLLPDNPFRHSFWVALTKEEHSNYTRDGVLLNIVGNVVYTDALEEMWSQSFQLTLVACPTSIVTSEYFHTLAKARGVDVPRDIPRWRKAVNWYVAKVEAMKNGES